MSIDNEHVQDHSCPGAIFLIDKSYLGKVGYPVLYNGPDNLPLEVVPGQQKNSCEIYKCQTAPRQRWPRVSSSPFGNVIFVPTIKLSIRSTLGRFIFVPSIPWMSYLRADNSIIHHLVSLFSWRPFNCQSTHPIWAICFYSVNLLA